MHPEDLHAQRLLSLGDVAACAVSFRGGTEVLLTQHVSRGPGERMTAAVTSLCSTWYLYLVLVVMQGGSVELALCRADCDGLPFDGVREERILGLRRKSKLGRRCCAGGQCDTLRCVV
jgi:hypothetical protein